MATQIRALTPALLGDYLAFFDRDAFADNPEWFGCYCRYLQFPGSKEAWNRATPAVNREGICDRISEGKARGYLAYVDGRPVGWCQAGRPSDVPSLKTFLGVKWDDPAALGVVTCFCISPTFRRQGLARQLLHAALEGFKAAGLTVAEAYPPKDPMTEAHDFPGPLRLYLDAGFAQVGEVGKQWIVRKSL